MITTRNAVKAVFQAMNQKDSVALASIVSDDVVFHFPGTPPLEGPVRVKRFLQILFRRYPDLHFVVDSLICEGDRAAAEWTNEGHDRKGELYRNAGVTVIGMKDGKIAYMSDTFKDTGAFLRK